jgi:hypothetical protein
MQSWKDGQQDRDAKGSAATAETQMAQVRGDYGSAGRGFHAQIDQKFGEECCAVLKERLGEMLGGIPAIRQTIHPANGYRDEIREAR